jgi:hypothetical protein
VGELEARRVSEMGAAWLGIGGVVVGAAITQIADSLRTRREQRERQRERAQLVLINLLRAGVEVAELGRGIATFPRTGGKLSYDFTSFDTAVRLLLAKADELAVLGQHNMASPIAEYIESARSVSEIVTSFGSKAEALAAIERLERAKLGVLQTGTRLGLSR